MTIKKQKEPDLNPEQQSLWEKILILAQRIDKLEYTVTDLRAQVTTLSDKEIADLRNIMQTAARDDAYRKHDWLKAVATIVGALILIGCFLWFTLISKVHNLEVEVKQQTVVMPHLVTKDELNQQLEKIKEIIKQSGIKK
jgi:hypothetical protein